MTPIPTAIPAEDFKMYQKMYVWLDIFPEIRGIFMQINTLCN